MRGANFFKKVLDLMSKTWYLIHIMKLKKAWRWLKKKFKKARVNKDGLMGSASRAHRVKKGKGSYKRRKKHQKKLDKDS